MRYGERWHWRTGVGKDMEDGVVRAVRLDTAPGILQRLPYAAVQGRAENLGMVLCVVGIALPSER
jgi:hypothetical protein